MIIQIIMSIILLGICFYNAIISKMTGNKIAFLAWICVIITEIKYIITIIIHHYVN